MLNYLEEFGNIGWDDRPITNADLAEFSQLVYNPFENIEHEDYQGKTLAEIYSDVYPDGFPAANWSWPENVQKQWSKLPECGRFANAKLNNFHSVFKPSSDEQFAAATFGIGDIGIVVFRGTDLSIVGWKEDFNMGYKIPLPCHSEAVNYLEKELGKYDEVYVVGQSKGGHLAVYASAHVADKSAIVKVLSLEGPGLDKATYDNLWDDIKDKVEIMLPDTSIIGMSLGYGGNYTVVKSTANGIMQHDPFTWTIENGEFIPDKLSQFSVYIHRIMHDFVEGTSDKEREILVDFLFKMVYSLEADDVDDLMKALITGIRKPIGILRDMNDDEKKVIKKLLKQMETDAKESAKLMVSLNKYKMEMKLQKYGKRI